MLINAMEVGLLVLHFFEFFCIVAIFKCYLGWWYSWWLSDSQFFNIQLEYSEGLADSFRTICSAFVGNWPGVQIYKISYSLSLDKVNHKSVVSSPHVILYDLPYSYRNYVLTLFYDILT